MTSSASGPSNAALDPAVFTPDAISPETVAFNGELAARLVKVPPIWTVPVAETREARESGRGTFGPLVLSERAVNRTIPGPAEPLTIRTFLPPTVTGVYLFLHGGGWTFGRAHYSDVNLEALSTGAQVAVASLDYRLGPEDPYPAGPEDCTAAALWLVEHAASEFGSSRLLIGGESAGAHLAAVTLLRLRDRYRLRPFSRANLVYGAYDLAGTPSVHHAPPDALVLPPLAIQWFLDQFNVRGRETDPDVSPLWADLRGMPPALFSVGTLDPLLDDSLFMYSRWIAAGNPAELAVYPGGVHGFNAFPYTLARQANQRIIDFLKA